MPNMQGYECKLCYAPIDPKEIKNGVVRCKFCGHTFTIAKPESKAASFLAIGEHSLDTAKFDEAYSAFKKAAELDAEEPEAYFGMALAEFKVQYLKALSDKEGTETILQPIVHETSAKKFADSKNVQKALELATPEQCKIYVERAEEIDYINEEFMELQKSGLDYDCFICVKVTDDETKERTKDYKAADDIYFDLREKGYKPFFSEREIGDKTGKDYEALILYAIYSSECMLVVCSDESYLNTKWVKNEYTRFLKLVKDEEKESDSIALAFGGKPIEKLPGKNGKIQGIDLRAFNAHERVLKFVETHTPEAKRRREEEIKRKAKEEEERRRILEELNKNREVKYCVECGTENPVNVKFCGECGCKEFASNVKELLEIQRQKAPTKKKIETLTAEELKEFVCNPEDFEISDGALIGYRGKCRKVRIPDGVTQINNDAFDKCQSVRGVFIPGSVGTICSGAFTYCTNLSELVISDGLETIEKWAFWSCGITKLHLPQSVVKIGEGAFDSCSRIESITVDPDNEYYAAVDNCLLTKDGKTLILGCAKSVIPSTVTTIFDSAFKGCSDLTNLVIPAGVTAIYDEAFSDCLRLISVALPEGLKNIGARAFFGCRSLAGVVIPNSVESIGKSAFAYCDSLRRVVMPRGIKNLKGDIFEKTKAKVIFT